MLKQFGLLAGGPSPGCQRGGMPARHWAGWLAAVAAVMAFSLPMAAEADWYHYRPYGRGPVYYAPPPPAVYYQQPPVVYYMPPQTVYMSPQTVTPVPGMAYPQTVQPMWPDPAMYQSPPLPTAMAPPARRPVSPPVVDRSTPVIPALPETMNTEEGDSQQRTPADRSAAVRTVPDEAPLAAPAVASPKPPLASQDEDPPPAVPVGRVDRQPLS